MYHFCCAYLLIKVKKEKASALNDQKDGHYYYFLPSPAVSHCSSSHVPSLHLSLPSSKNFWNYSSFLWFCNTTFHYIPIFFISIRLPLPVPISVFLSWANLASRRAGRRSPFGFHQFGILFPPFEQMHYSWLHVFLIVFFFLFISIRLFFVRFHPSLAFFLSASICVLYLISSPQRYTSTVLLIIATIILTLLFVVLSMLHTSIYNDDIPHYFYFCFSQKMLVF